MKRVLVEWLDAVASNSWTNKDDSNIGGMACVTIGFLVHEDEKWLRIAHTDGGEAWHGVFDIPRGCVQGIKDLE